MKRILCMAMAVLMLCTVFMMTGCEAKTVKLGMGVELNKGDMAFKDNETDTVLRMFRIAKSCGCKFYLGCDVHRPKGFSNSKEVFERVNSKMWARTVARNANAFNNAVFFSKP